MNTKGQAVLNRRGNRVLIIDKDLPRDNIGAMELEIDNDYLWLTSDDASELLQMTVGMILEKTNPLSTAKRLRKTVSPSRAAIIMEQANLRIRARRKFEHADQMFFSGKSLEQSTSSVLADYKAKRFAGVQRLADVCCGIGGDLISLAQRESNAAAMETVGIEKGPLIAHLANANLAALNVGNAKVLSCSFEDFDIAPFDGLHFDPDRRVKGRTTSGDLFAPSMPDIFDRLKQEQQLVAIKVAPATEVDVPKYPIEREWIGDWRECKQQVVWAGPGIAEAVQTATIVANDGTSFQFRHPENEAVDVPEVADTIPKYIYEPHASILAARLRDAVASRYSLRPISRGVAYLGSDSLLTDVEPLLKRYRVDDVLPVDLKLIQKKLTQMGVGELVLKKRGVDQVLADRVSRLKLSGDQKTTRHDVDENRHLRLEPSRVPVVGDENRSSQSDEPLH